MTYADALKAMRRNIYLFKNNWRTFVFCRDEAQRCIAFDEARWILEASSIAVKECKYVTRTIVMADDAVLCFIVPHPLGGVDDYVKGQEITQAIVLYALTDRDEDIIRAIIRPGDMVGREHLRYDEVDDV